VSELPQPLLRVGFSTIDAMLTVTSTALPDRRSVHGANLDFEVLKTCVHCSQVED
jgi:hypothetical protein